MAQIISAIQQKGGAGKSAMLDCIAGCMANDKAKVLIIDTDPQQTSTDWAEMSNLDNIDIMELLREDSLREVIEKVSPNYDAILIDTAGYDSRMASYAIAAADLLLIPTNGSLNDVKGAVRTWKHVISLTDGKKKPPVTKIVFWKIKINTSVFHHAEQTLKDAKAPVLIGAVKNLTGFDKMTWNGGLPDGAGLQAVLGFMRALKESELLEFYELRKAA